MGEGTGEEGERKFSGRADCIFPQQHTNCRRREGHRAEAYLGPGVGAVASFNAGVWG